MKPRHSILVFLILTLFALPAVPAAAADIDNDGVDDAADACVNTPAGIPVNAEGRPLGDLDLDCDCDLVDFALFADSFTGPLAPLVETCDDGLDNDGDGFIDCADAPACPSGTACSDHAECGAGACVCVDSWEDCDTQTANGCEADLLTDSAHCGTCFNPCTNAHGATTCVTAMCEPDCDSLWGDCDGDPDDGCETSLASLTNCGSCMTPCSLANATETCSAGTCQLTACNDGFCNQNTTQSDGCEFDLDTNPPCGSATVLGTVAGDVSSSPLNFQGHGERWFRVYVSEQDSNPFSPEELCSRIQLTVPAGTNYDLFAYCDGCTTVAASSTNAGSTAELVNVRWEEETFGGAPSGSDSGRDVYIRVQFISGATCPDYSLTVTGDICSGPNTCASD